MIEAHTRLLIRVGEWETKSLDASLTLRGADLKAAEQWLELGPTKAPPPTALQTRFIIESRRQATKRRFQVLGGAAVALVIAGVLGTLMLFERRQAAHQEAIAVARRLASTAERAREQTPVSGLATSPQERSLQLAAEAIRRLDAIGKRSLDADLALRRALAILPQRVASLKSHVVSGGKLDAMAFTADGELVAVSRSPLESTAWDLRTRERVAMPPFVADRMNVVLAEDGRWLAAVVDPGRGERTIELRDAKTLAQVAQFTGLPHIVELALGPGGTLAASLSADAALGDTRVTRVWQLPARESIASLPFVSSPSISADGRYLAGIVDDKPVIWSTERLRAGNAAVLTTLDLEQPLAVQFSSDSSRLVVRSGDGPERVSVWAVGEWTQEREIERDGFVAAGPSAHHLLVRDPATSAVVVIDSHTNRGAARVPGTKDTAVAWSPDGQLFAVQNGQAVDLWRVMLHGSASAGVDAGESAFAFGADAARLTVLERRGEPTAPRLVASTWDLSSLQRIGEVDFGSAPNVATFSADGRWLVLGSAGRARVIDVATSRVVYDAVVHGTAVAVTLSENGKFLAVLTDGGTLSVWQLDPPRLLASAPQAASAVNNLLAISDDAAQLTAINLDGNKRSGAALSVRQWRVGSITQTVSRPIGQMTSGFAAPVCALSTNGEAMAVNTSYAAIRVRDTRTGRDLAVVDEADREARCAFSADGRYLAVSGADASLSIWDIAAKEELARIELPANARAVAFSPDSRDVAVLGIDGVLRRWPLRYTDLLAQACARLISNMAGSDWGRFAPAEPYRPTCDKLPTAPEERR